MSDVKTVQLSNLSELVEHKNFFETNADGVVTIGTHNEGYDVMNFVFLSTSPVIGLENNEISVQGMQRTKVASITMSKQKALDFYNSLKSILED
ncbi:hypothetical protein ACLF4E_004370 [Cronobacter malonaticus]|uniref:hypothetical protein n=1 Tax=Cronobacter sakazakii TaxID=28141 RepID=UPI00084E21CE|nr:hypothetical protein [Cronobacter sakazakii]MCI0197301.1 hypothetical protein [Cronobacter sakazakii]MCI0227774.1 hypothetical protein [Cronobacter sakazakii]MDQ9182495.1 hypothetical protein [Cronobacter sakazakii]PUW50083.1 hypothetical protein AUM98_04610 [Cronobacter sakazakii]PUW56680.1 hypothetical protein CBR20_19880 [Cronobacter sakazakii]